MVQSYAGIPEQTLNNLPNEIHKLPEPQLSVACAAHRILQIECFESSPLQKAAHEVLTLHEEAESW